MPDSGKGWRWSRLRCVCIVFQNERSLIERMNDRIPRMWEIVQKLWTCDCYLHCLAFMHALCFRSSFGDIMALLRMKLELTRRTLMHPLHAILSHPLKIGPFPLRPYCLFFWHVLAVFGANEIEAVNLVIEDDTKDVSCNLQSHKHM